MSDLEIVVENETTEIKELEEKYVVYGHYRDDGVCFYVGIGDKKRPYYFSKDSRSEFWHRYVKKHCASGKPEVKIWAKELTWEKACAMEKQWIALYGRRDLGTGCLVNLTDGGEGTVGWIPSEETKQKMSQSNKGKLHSEEAKQKISQASKGEKNPRYGKSHSEEARLKMSQVHKGKKGKPHSEETKQKMSQASKGKTLSEEHRLKISQARKGKTLSEETRLKMSLARKGEKNPRYGKSLSEEHRLKISQVHKGKTPWNKGKSCEQQKKQEDT